MPPRTAVLSSTSVPRAFDGIVFLCVHRTLQLRFWHELDIENGHTEGRICDSRTWVGGLLLVQMCLAGEKTAWTEVGASKPRYGPVEPVYSSGAYIIVRLSWYRAFLLSPRRQLLSEKEKGSLEVEHAGWLPIYFPCSCFFVWPSLSSCVCGRPSVPELFRLERTWTRGYASLGPCDCVFDCFSVRRAAMMRQRCSMSGGLCS